MSKIAVADLKKYLKDKKEPLLIEEIIALFNAFPIVQDYYSSRLNKNSSELILEKYKEIIKEQIFPDTNFPELKYSVCRKAISEFQRISKDKLSIADLMLYYVECGVRCTNEYGDIDEPFYNSMTSMFKKALDYMTKNNLKDNFAVRCKKIFENTRNIGWGFSDDIEDVFYSYFE